VSVILASHRQRVAARRFADRLLRAKLYAVLAIRHGWSTWPSRDGGGRAPASALAIVSAACSGRAGFGSSAACLPVPAERSANNRHCCPCSQTLDEGARRGAPRRPTRRVRLRYAGPRACACCPGDCRDWVRPSASAPSVIDFAVAVSRTAVGRAALRTSTIPSSHRRQRVAKAFWNPVARRPRAGCCSRPCFIPSRSRIRPTVLFRRCSGRPGSAGTPRVHTSSSSALIYVDAEAVWPGCAARTIPRPGFSRSP